MSQSLRDIFRRRQVRQPMDERLPDGRTVDELIATQGDIAGTPMIPTRNNLPQPIPAPQDQMATRPRSFKDALSRPMQAPMGSFEPPPPTQTTNLGQGSTFTEGGTDDVRARRTQPRDFIADDEAYLRDLRNKPRTWRDKLVDVTDALNVVAGGQKRILPTKRERAIGEVEDRIGQGLTIGKTRQAIEQGQMVPFQLPDGSWTQIPLKNAATVGSRQQNQVATLSQRKAAQKAHEDRWATMGKHEAAQDALRIYTAGAADDDEDLRDLIAKRMGLPEGTKLPPAKYGDIKTDDNGNFIVIDKRKPTAPVSVTAPNAEGVATPVGSMQKTTEQGRERRFKQGEEGRNYRATLPARTPAGGARGAKPDATAQRRAAQLTGKIEETRKKLERFDSRNLGQRTPDQERQRKAIADEAASAITELSNLNAGYEAGMGTGGYPYFKQVGASDLDSPIVGTPVQKSGRTIEGAIEAFKRNKKLNPSGRAPTADEVARMKAALGQ